MTQRLGVGKPAPFGGETIQVGAVDSHEAHCRAWFEPGADALAAGAYLASSGRACAPARSPRRPAAH
jgi:hypothetical protein